MKHTLPLLTTLALTGAASAQTVLINETDSDGPGDDTQEFIELVSVDASGAPMGGASLNGLVLVFFNGSDDLSYEAFDLAGFTTNAEGLFVVGNPEVNGVGLAFDPGARGALQNGADAVALISGSAAGFPNDSPIPTEGVLDVVIYGTSDSDDTGLIQGFSAAAGTPIIQFDEAENELKDTQSISRIPDGGSAFSSEYEIRDASPGLLNNPSNAFTLSIGASSISESSGSPLPASVSIVSILETDLVVNIANDDASELSAPESVTIIAGQTSAPIDVTPLDDSWSDGDREVTLTVSASLLNISPDSATVTVADDDGDIDPVGIVINEIHFEPDFELVFSEDDANRDGTGDSFDEFVEIVNTGTAALDLSGFMLGDRVAVRHEFPEETVLQPGCAIVVFGGGAAEGNRALYGGATTQNANVTPATGLGLNDSGDSVRLIDTNGVEIFGADYTADPSASGDGSTTRFPDLTGDFSRHLNVLDGELKISPGLFTDGVTRFCDTPDLVVDFSPISIPENGGSSTLTITREGPIDTAMEVALTSSDLTELIVPPSVTIAAGNASVQVVVSAVDDEIADGAIDVSVIAVAAGFTDGEGTLTVEDDGDRGPEIFINELHATVSGASRLEFVELYFAGGAVDLSDLVLVLINGATSRPYGALDLDGFSTNTEGFFVIGTENVTSSSVLLPGGSLQNGVDAVALAFGDASDFNNSDPFPSDASILDAVVYNGVDQGLATSLGVTPADSSPSDTTTESIQRFPDGGTLRNSSNFVKATPTPNASNSTGAGAVGSAAYETFAAENGITGTPTDDQDGDGIPNAVEFAIAGFGPGTTDALPLPVGNRISIAKSPEAGNDGGTDIVVQVSTDLLNWGSTETMVVTDDAASLVVDYAGDSGVAFFRVSVTTAP